MVSEELETLHRQLLETTFNILCLISKASSSDSPFFSCTFKDMESELGAFFYRGEGKPEETIWNGIQQEVLKFKEGSNVIGLFSLQGTERYSG